MLFNSYVFLYVFLPLTLLFYAITPSAKKNLALTITSFIFYGYWDFKLCFLLLFSITINFWLGKQIYRSPEQSDKRNYLFLVLFINLGLLSFFKYTGFFIDSIRIIFPDLSFNTLHIILPIGISFFTFQEISYAIDIYRGKSLPVRRFVDFACYISMFPQLIAGPIVRYEQIADQLSSRKHSIEKTAYGIRRFIVGLGKKVLLADTMAFISEQQLYQGDVNGLNIWIGIIAFSLQIYFDFSGYSDMAIGLGSVFGFKLPENFRSPYHAKGIYDFWRRWHMTLSGWLRDYIYIPLGGSRCTSRRWLLNIMTTFLLCGLWHGPAWTFVVWGGYFGLLIILERPFRSQIQRMPSWLSIPATNTLVIIGWVFFKSSNLEESALWLKMMCGYVSGERGPLPPNILLIILVCFQVGCWTSLFQTDRIYRGTRWSDPLLAIIFLACFISTMGVKVSPFIYYQF